MTLSNVDSKSTGTIISMATETPRWPLTFEGLDVHGEVALGAVDVLTCWTSLHNADITVDQPIGHFALC